MDEYTRMDTKCRTTRTIPGCEKVNNLPKLEAQEKEAQTAEDDGFISTRNSRRSEEVNNAIKIHIKEHAIFCSGLFWP